MCRLEPFGGAEGTRAIGRLTGELGVGLVERPVGSLRLVAGRSVPNRFYSYIQRQETEIEK